MPKAIIAIKRKAIVKITIPKEEEIIAIKRKAIVKITIPKEEEIVRLIKENQQQQKKEGIECAMVDSKIVEKLLQSLDTEDNHINNKDNTLLVAKVKKQEEYKVKKKDFSLRHIDNKLRDFKMCYSCIEARGSDILYAPKDLKKSYILTIISILSDNFAFYHVLKEMQTFELCVLAVKIYPDNFCYVRKELQNLELCVLAVTKSPPNFNYVREEIKTTEFFTQLKAYYNNNIKVEGNNIVFTIAGKDYKYFLTNNYKQLKELSKYINKVHSDNQIKTETETKPDIRKLLANIKDLTAADNKAITYLSKEIYKTLEELVTIKPSTNTKTNTKTEVENNNFTFGGDESEYESEYESRNESEYELRGEPRIIESRDGFQIIEWGGEFQLIYLGQASN